MSYKILFADDSRMINEVMEFALESEDFKADFSNTYAQVISKVRKNKYNLIIIDIQLNGFDVIKKIHKSEKNKNAEIFFLSENSDIEIKKKAKKNGVTGWIVKPFIPEKLVKRIKLYLQRNYKNS